MTNVPFLNSVTNVLSKNDVKGLELADALMDITKGNEKLDDLLTLQSSASEIDRSVNDSFMFTFGDNLFDSSSEKHFLDTSRYVPAITGGTSPIFDNASSFTKYGNKTMRFGESASGDTTIFAKKISITNSIDLTQISTFSFWVYVDGDLVVDLASASSYGSVSFAIGDLNFANAKLVNILGVGGGSWHKGWNNITVLKSEFSVNIVGAFDWTNAQTFQIRIDTASSNIGTLFHMDSIFIGGNKPTKTPVCITLDDSTKDSYDMVKIMNKYGIKVSSFVIPDFIDNHGAYPSYMTIAMTEDLYDSGNHIGFHHQNIDAFAVNKTLIKTTSDWLKNKGFVRDNGYLYGSYPNGSYNQDSIDYAKSIGILGLRSLTGIARDDSKMREATTGLIYYESLMNGGIADICRINSAKPTSISDFTSKLNTAISKGGGFLTYHHLFSEFVSKAEWETLAKYLKTKIDDGTIECLTFPQFCKKYSI